MLQLKNQTPFEAALFMFPDEQGVDTVYVVLKATFELDPEMHLAEKQIPIAMADEYHGDAATSSLKVASEAHLRKPGTDVVVIGDAIAPGGKPVRQLDIALSVAGRTKFYTVFGDRKWGGMVFKGPGKPEPFTRMPLVYERAFGGANPPTPKGLPDLQPMNPVGRGYLGQLPMKDYERAPLPNLEDKKKLLNAPKDAAQLKPVGLGFIAPSWQPRLAFAGTYDEAWRKTRAPYLPKDFNPKYFHVAHPDWVFEKPLQGGEMVQTLHLSKQPRLNFTLPRCQFKVQARVQGRTQDLTPLLETVLLMPNDEKLALTWRAALPCDKKVLKVEEISIQLDELELGQRV